MEMSATVLMSLAKSLVFRVVALPAAILLLAAPSQTQRDPLKFGFRLGPAPAPMPEFSHQSRSGSFEFGSDTEQPLAALAALGERALQKLRLWIGRGREVRSRADPYRVFFCSQVDKIRAIEHAIGLPQMDPNQGERVEFRGGYYSSARVIAIPAKLGEDMRWDFLHEIGHAVYSEFLLGYLITINEGIAEYSAERMIEAELGAGELYRQRHGWLLDQCRQAVADGLPSLEDFVPLGHWQFLDAAVRDRNYALAWSLIRFLNRSQDPSISGLFGEFMQRMSRSTRPWQSFQETWDIATLDPLWRDYVKGIARWTSVYGDWSYRSNLTAVSVSPDASSWTLWRQKPRPGDAFSINFLLAPNLDAKIGIGFVLGHADWDNFVVVELHPGDLLTIARREKGVWEEALDFPVPGARGESRSLRLDCDAKGWIKVSIGGEVVAHHHLGALTHAGWFGLFAEHSAAHRSDGPVRVEFRDATVSIDR